MTKIKFLMLSISSAGLAINFFVYQQIMLGLAFAALSALLLGICIYKYQRDHHIITQARQEQVCAPILQSTPQVAITRNCPSLFVPKSLEQHK